MCPTQTFCSSDARVMLWNFLTEDSQSCHTSEGAVHTLCFRLLLRVHVQFVCLGDGLLHGCGKVLEICGIGVLLPPTEDGVHRCFVHHSDNLQDSVDDPVE